MQKILALFVSVVLLFGCKTIQPMTVGQMMGDRSDHGYLKVYTVSYDRAYDAVITACTTLNLSVLDEDLDDGVLVVSGNMNQGKFGEHVGIYFDPYHEERTAIRVMTRPQEKKGFSMKKEELVDWGRDIHTEVSRALGLNLKKGKMKYMKRERGAL